MGPKTGAEAIYANAQEEQLLRRLRARSEMMAALEEFVAAVPTECAPTSIDAVEETVVARTREFGRVTLQAWAQQAEEQTAHEQQAQRPQRRMRAKKELRWLTSLGVVSVVERVWRGPGCAYLRPFSRHHGLRYRGWSRRLQRLACDLGVEEAFAPAAQRLHEHHGVSVTTSGVRRHTLRHAHVIGAGKTHATSVRTLPAQRAASLLVEADGTMLPLVEFAAGTGDRRKRRTLQWHEGRLLAAREVGSAQTHYAASFGDVDEAGWQWTWAAAQARWASPTHVHAVIDGAEWIERQHRTHFGRHGTYLVDFFHVCEYLAAAAPDQPAWLETQKQRLRTNQLAAVLAELAARREPADTSDEHAPARVSRGRALDPLYALVKQGPDVGRRGRIRLESRRVRTFHALAHRHLCLGRAQLRQAHEAPSRGVHRDLKPPHGNREEWTFRLLVHAKFDPTAAPANG